MFPDKELLVALESDISECSRFPSGAFISSDMSVVEARIQSLRQSLVKKLEPSGGNDAADAKALEKFNAINASIVTTPFEYPAETEQDALFWDYFRDNFIKALTPGDVNFDLAYVRETFAVGPGASLKCENDNFYTKLFTSSITMTHPYLLALYRAAVVESETWSEAERLRHERFGETMVSGNRLFFVPKTADISRTCCTEPLVNMMLQKAIGAFLEDCLRKSFGITLNSQPGNNRELSRLGSIDGSFGTIDLASASDSISWSLIQRICPSNLLGYLRLARCETAELPDGSKTTLNMISTMGNGFTFPLQTIIFACAVRSVYQLMGFPSVCPKSQFGVFGDDIVVRSEAYSFLVRGLEKLGFKVNDTKSFNCGPFRESCGYDWFNGAFIRGVYIKKLETVSDVYSAINRLTRWSAMAGVRLRNTILFLRRRLSIRSQDLLVPFSESIDCGIQVPFELSKPKVDARYWFSYRKLINVPIRTKVPVSLKESKSLSYRHFNECGWGVTFLGGFARREDLLLESEPGFRKPLKPEMYPDAYMTQRLQDGARRTRVVQRSIPFWDWLGSKEDQEGVIPDVFFSYGAWKGAVAAAI